MGMMQLFKKYYDVGFLGAGGFGFLPTGGAGGGGGGTVTGAENGLSLDGTDVVLGNDQGDLAAPGRLLSNRSIPMGGFLFEMLNSTGFQWFALDEANGNATLGPQDGSHAAFFTSTISAANPAASMQANDSGSSGSFIVQATSGVAQRARITLQDNAPVFSEFLMDNLLQQASISWDLNGLGLHPYFLIDVLNGFYRFGNIESGGPYVEFFDGSNFISFLSSGIAYPEMMSLDFSIGNVLIGDVTGNANGTQLQVDDAAKLVSINNLTTDVQININGETGFTGSLADAITAGKNVVSGYIVD